MNGLEVNYKLGREVAAEMSVVGFEVPVLGNHEAWGASGKLCLSQNNHTMSILTGCAGDESR